MAVNLSFIGGAGWQFFDNNGLPLAGGKIYTYAAGTTTPLVTYTARDGVTPNTNPIILDSAGRTPAQIWSTEGLLYKYVVATANDVVLRTWDNIGGSTVASDLAQDLASTTDNAEGDALIGFKQSGPAGFLAGAVARTVNTKLQDYVSVKDFGATGNGSTDDTAAINAAIAALSGRNSIGLFFPEGVYKVTSSINVNRGQISLVGAGMSATVIRCHADGVNVFNVRSTPPAATSGVVISDMQIDIGGGVSTTTGAGIYLERVANAIIDNVSLGSHASCIQIMGCFNIVTSNIIISYAAGSPGGRNGVYVSRSTPTYSSAQSGNIFINNMTATGGGQPLDTVTPGAAYGILFDSVDGLWVNNSYFGYFDQASACGSLIGYDITGIKFDNTWLDASRNFCLWLNGSGGAIGLHEFVGLRMVGGPFCTYNAYIEGAWGDIHFNGGHAEQAISHNIAVTSTGGNIIFDGFDCVGSALRTAQSCMYFDGPDYVRIVGCTINGNSTTATLHGFYINDGTGHVVVGNTITNCAIAGLFDGAADFWTAADNMDATTTNTFAITNSASGAYYYLMNIGQKSTGWGTPTGAAKIANFPGATATLTQCSQTVAQLITELKSTGLLAD